MREINWNIFKTKFNERESTAFESLSYQLFCDEHDQPCGIFRFKNQTGIETEPIASKGKIIGFQAKYYDVRLADKKADIIDSLKKAKGKNKELSILYIYLNKEFSESSDPAQKDPKYKIEIEAEAAKIQVSIIWKVPSHFEIQLADIKNQHIADYYFSNGPTIFNFLNGISSHTETILFAIQNDIKFNNEKIHIDRTSLINEIKSLQKDIIIINGEGGCGKTALVKDIYTQLKDHTPFYVFKAVEFDVPNIQNIFSQYGGNTFDEFLQIHKNDLHKIIVIDSAEGLSDINNREIFKQFLSALLKDSWQIIFTTRNNYLEDLRFQFIDVYRVPFQSFIIEKPTVVELTDLSEKYHFKLPDDHSLRELLRNLFYLDEYLTNYEQFNSSTNLQRFKNILWNKKIQNSAFKSGNTHIRRENCFIEIARERVSKGKFFVQLEHSSEEILALLQQDEIIKYDSNNYGYFITHDIYEEWALEVYIDRAFNSCEKYADFFTAIGSSLAIRRSFRRWLQNKILESSTEIEQFINQALASSDIDSYWKDEVFIALLLSEDTDFFFEKVRDMLFEHNFFYLKRIVFLLRIACKELDETHNKLYENEDIKYVFTKPKGSGWESIVSLIFKNLSCFNEENVKFFIPILKEWSSKNPIGKTTRIAGLISIEIYRKIETDEEFKHTNLEKDLVSIILNTSLEIREELETIIVEILGSDTTKRDAPYYELVNSVLNAQYENFIFVRSLPKEVISLARKFWIDENKANAAYPYHSPIGDEEYFGLNRTLQIQYSPASAFQTPILYLLERDFGATLDFIIELMNKVTSYYEKSKFKENLTEILLPISENKHQAQLISSDFWGMLSGSGHSPEVLQSVHMALEKFLLEKTPDTEESVIESWLLYILEKSRSASLTAVVASIIKANTDKFFNIAKILFSSPEILMHDRIASSEYQRANFGLFGKGWNNEYKYYEDERDQAAKQPHRKTTLEWMMINYQFFRYSSTPSEVADERLKAIQEIIDDLYDRYPEKANSSSYYMSLRLLIAQLDRRKMSPIIEEKEDKLLINFNPEIASDLKEHSEEALSSIEDFSRYIGLKLWANNKFDKRTNVSNPEKYNNSPGLALTEVKELINNLNADPEKRLISFNHEVPAFVCAALLKDFSEQFEEDDLMFCADVVLQYGTQHFNPDYDYQISDGVEVAISALPALAKLFPDRLPSVKVILLLTLFDSNSIGAYKRICDYAIETIYAGMLTYHGETNEEFIKAFLKFKPLFEELKEKSPKNWNTRDNTIEKFHKKYEKQLMDFGEGIETAEKIKIEEDSLENLEIVFKLIPVDTKNMVLIEMGKNILSLAAKTLLVKNRDYDFNYSFRHNFLRRCAYFLLYREVQAIKEFAEPFVKNLNDSQESVYFLEEIIIVQDQINKYEEFWKLWLLFYDVIINFYRNGRGHYREELIRTYMLAGNNWNNVKEWHSLKERNKQFYQKLTVDIGSSSAALYSISKILNGIASNFLDEGIQWVSEIIAQQKTEYDSRYGSNTVFYLENLVRIFVYLNREKVKKDIKIKKQILTILNYLIERTSVNAYLIREDIL
ncbi:AVAST type 4 anti-phage nuclease Avs4 [Flavobacterium sp. SORGH_AS_0622]|uniref:AVAST type 4 anti-phage nuclease Avs4 n=1 Tax=Flavobacterium sp. SORGH_AS_0622 TaxID=3041772 RepID=UPI0027D7B5FA|nr:AVAST type 4 anti-phage nuclease Avs4 [Flavobacterium sp. SORGH_AS_0622]